VIPEEIRDKRITIEVPYFLFGKTIYFRREVTMDEAVAILRSGLLDEAFREMRKNNCSYAVVRCPCCGRSVKITIEEAGCRGDDRL